MKKKLLLFALLPLLTFGITFGVTAAVVHEEPAIVLAEEEVTEHTYTYTYEEHSIVLVLRSDNTATITVDGKSVNCSYSRVGNIVTLIANGKSLVITVDDTTSMILSCIEELNTGEESGKSVKDNISDLYNTYIVPLFTSVSVTSVLSALIAIVSLVNNIKRKKHEDTVLDKVLALMILFTDLVTEIKNGKEVSKESIQVFNTECEKVLGEIKLLKHIPEKLNQLSLCVAKSTEIIGKIASHDQTLVSSGIAQDCQGLVNEIKAIAMK